MTMNYFTELFQDLGLYSIQWGDKKTTNGDIDLILYSVICKILCTLNCLIPQEKIGNV